MNPDPAPGGVSQATYSPPAAIADMPHLDGVTHRTVQLPGVRLHVAEAGSGEPLLLLHGFPLHWWAWHRAIPRLAQHYRVICPDLRGAGWSDAPRDGYTPEQLLADLLALLYALEIPRARIIAHDWGAIVAYNLALRHPERVERLVSLAAPPPFTQIGWKFLPLMRFLWFQPVVATGVIGPRQLGRGRQRLTRHLLHGFAARPDTFSDADVENYLAPLRDPAHARAGSALYRHFILPSAMKIARRGYMAEHLTPPTLVIGGGADPAMQPDLLGDYSEHAADLTLEFIPGAGHYVADDEPEQFADSALRFFARA